MMHSKSDTSFVNRTLDIAVGIVLLGTLIVCILGGILTVVVSVCILTAIPEVGSWWVIGLTFGIILTFGADRVAEKVAPKYLRYIAGSQH